METTPTITIGRWQGRLRVRGWPVDGPRPPHGLEPSAGGELTGACRHRRAVRELLAAAGLAFVDQEELPPIPALAPPALPPPVAALLSTWRSARDLGIVCGLAAGHRHELTIGAIGAVARPALVVVPDSAAASLWQQALGAGRFAQQAVQVATAAFAADRMPWLAGRHELLAVDAVDSIPAHRFATIADDSAALARLGFVGEPDGRRLLEWSAGLGPVLAVATPGGRPASIVLRIALPPADRQAYDDAWHEFLCAFDAWAAAHATAGFAAFVAAARGDPCLRPGLLAWHRALHCASWNDAKSTMVAELLSRHRGERVVVFTPDRASAYALARDHLVPPITAELPRRERDAMVAAFVRGELRVLVGPRLLDHGVPEALADVGILAGGGIGRAQRSARLRRVAPTGLVYELVGLDTVESGRAHRWRGTTAAETAVVDVRGRRTGPGLALGP